MKYKHFVHPYILDPAHPLTIALIGAGGTGSQVLTSLGRMNYALKELGHPGLHVKVYDADIVTPANCGRQLFSPIEVGRNKAEVLTTKLNMFFGTSWESIPEMYDEKTEHTNIVISCVDTIASRLAINKNLECPNKREMNGYDMQVNYYWLDFGNTQSTGQVILGTKRDISQNKKKTDVGKLRCVTDFFDLKKVNEKDSGPSCSLAEALTKQDLFINSTLAQIGMALMWKMFTKGVLETQGAFLNLDTMRVNPIKIEYYGKADR